MTDVREEFYVDQHVQSINIYIGIVVIIVGVIPTFLSSGSAFPITLGFLAFGLFIIIYALRTKSDKELKLSITSNSIWTKKLGWVLWENLQDAFIVKHTDSERNEQYLHLYLKKAGDLRKTEPDDIVPIIELENYDTIQTLIYSHFTYRKAAQDNPA